MGRPYLFGELAPWRRAELVSKVTFSFAVTHRQLTRQTHLDQDLFIQQCDPGKKSRLHL